MIKATCFLFAASLAQAASFDITQYGAIGNGTTLASAAINKAIDAASAAGRGTVHFPAGTWLSGSIHLKSNVALYFEPGSTLLATENSEAYDEAQPNQWEKYRDFGHSHFHNSLIWGEGLENVSILGPGRIDGKGLTRSANKRVGNKAISLKLCRNVVIPDVSILMGGHFGILVTAVERHRIQQRGR